jgi:hypothetical protein
MKKVLILSLVLSLYAAVAFAADITSSTVIGNGAFTPSSKVGIKLISLPSSYAATSAHVNGTFQYGTVGGSGVVGDPSKIVKKTLPTQTGTVGAPDAPESATSIGTGWAE